MRGHDMETKKRLNVSVDENLHRDLKIAAITKGITISSYVIEAIAEKIEREKQNKEN